MKTSASILLLCSCVCAIASAQTFEISVSAAYPRIPRASLGSLSVDTPIDNETTLRGEYGYGARFTINTPGYYGHEIGYNINRATLHTTVYGTLEDGSTFSFKAQDRVRVRQAYYNFLIYFMPKGERWRPFVTGGVHATQYERPNIVSFPDRSRKFGANWGGGLKLKLLPHTQVRLDFRDYINGKPYDLNFADVLHSGGLWHNMEASVGFGITF